MKHLVMRCLAILLFWAPVASADLIPLIGTFSGLNENPPNASPGTGFVYVTVDTTAHTMSIHAVWSGLLGTTTAAHIHCCADPTANAGVATQTPSFIGFALGVTSGVFDTVLDTLATASYNPAFVTANGGTAAGAEAALFAGMFAGRSYFNIHTTFRPGGELRANLRVPEPSTLALFGFAALALGALRRRRVQGLFA